jgi:DNA-directed RNA polymerase specialized sigma24 family protein
LNHYILSYHPAIFNSVVRLTKCADLGEAEKLTQEVLADLGDKAEEFEAEDRKGVFIYRLVLEHVFLWLRARGEHERIRHLQQILLIHPSQYFGGGSENPPNDTGHQGGDGGI